MNARNAPTRGYAQRWSASQQAAAQAVAKDGAGAPIDHAHLARYTLGDRALELEILDLFLGEAPNTLARIESLSATVPTDANGWVRACHTLKGSARAVGAFGVADAAESAEREADLAPVRLRAHVEAMAARIDAASRYVAEWRRRT